MSSSESSSKTTPSLSSSSSISPSTNIDETNKKDEINYLSMGIVIFMIGAALGNVMLAKRTREVMTKLESNRNPFTVIDEMQKRAKETNEQFAKNHEEFIEFFRKEEARRHQKQKASSSSSSTSTSSSSSTKSTTPSFFANKYLEGHLSTLNLKPSEFKKENVKKAFQKEALKWHPDRLAYDDPRRNEYQTMFLSVHDSYKTLIKYLDDQNKMEKRN